MRETQRDKIDRMEREVEELRNEIARPDTRAAM